tara:strand:- start:128 stop:325 length:198 start_codon:yes stop_codon:yes gene_type:complete
LRQNGELPFQPQPAEILDEGLGKLGFTSRLIEIVVAQEKLAASSMGALLGNPKRAGVSEVKESGG